MKKVFNINFYTDKQDRQPVKEYIDSLQNASETNKDSRIKLKKVFEYLEILSQNGVRISISYVKHIDDDIWELRPLNDRIFFFCWKADSFILLHHFKKKTQKTPQKSLSRQSGTNKIL